MRDETGVYLESRENLCERDRNPTNVQSAGRSTLVDFNGRSCQRGRTINVQI